MEIKDVERGFLVERIFFIFIPRPIRILFLKTNKNVLKLRTVHNIAKSHTNLVGRWVTSNIQIVFLQKLIDQNNRRVL